MNKLTQDEINLARMFLNFADDKLDWEEEYGDEGGRTVEENDQYCDALRKGYYVISKLLKYQGGS